MNAPKKYRMKSVTVEAMQWDGTAEGATPIIDWILAGDGTARWYDLDGSSWIFIDTPEGMMRAYAYDYVIRNAAGVFYPGPIGFSALYEEVEA